MGDLNKMSERELDVLRKAFTLAMDRAKDLFGNDAFRKRGSLNARRQPINKALFEAWSVCLVGLQEDQMLKLNARKEPLIARYIGLINDPVFLNSVSQGTGDIKKVQLRFREISRIVQETLRD